MKSFCYSLLFKAHPIQYKGGVIVIPIIESLLGPFASQYNMAYPRSYSTIELSRRDFKIKSESYS